MNEFNKKSDLSDAVVNLSFSKEDSKEDLSQKKEEGLMEKVADSDFNQQGESSIKKKLERIFSVGDLVVFNSDTPREGFYKGYLCCIIGVHGKDHFEIEFFSEFSKNDNSRKSIEKFPSFEFPISNYVTVVNKEEIIRLEKQDLYYKTYFS